MLPLCLHVSKMHLACTLGRSAHASDVSSVYIRSEPQRTSNSSFLARAYCIARKLRVNALQMGAAYRSQLMEVSTSGKDDGVFGAPFEGNMHYTDGVARGEERHRSCGNPSTSKRCVSFSDDHGYPLERFHVIDPRKDSLGNTCIPLGVSTSMRNTSDIITNAGLVLVMLCVVVGTYIM